jgi:hypothetical protein
MPSCFCINHYVSETGFCLHLRWNLLSWGQSLELVPISGHLHQHKIRHTNQAQHKPSARVKTNIKNIFKKLHTYEVYRQRIWLVEYARELKQSVMMLKARIWLQKFYRKFPWLDMLLCKESYETRINEMLWDGWKMRIGMVRVRNTKSKKDVEEILERTVSRTLGVVR